MYVQMCCAEVPWIIMFLSCAESVGLRNKLWRSVEELRSDSFSSGIPCEFLCPITRELMREPVIAAGNACRLAPPPPGPPRRRFEPR